MAPSPAMASHPASLPPSYASSQDDHDFAPVFPDKSHASFESTRPSGRAADDAEDDGVDVDDDDDEEADVGGYGRRRRAQTRRSRLILCLLVLLASLIGLLAGSSWKSPLSTNSPIRPAPRKHLDLERAVNGTFSPHRKELAWLAVDVDGTGVSDGWFSIVDEDRNIWLDHVGRAANSSLKTARVGPNRRLLVNASSIVDEAGTVIDWADWKLSPDMAYLLVLSDKQPIWRHSSLSTVHIFRFADQSTIPLLLPDRQRRGTRFAGWAPTSAISHGGGHTLAWVDANKDLFVIDSEGLDRAGRAGRPVEAQAARLTTSGAKAGIFNGVPDWVYEEEVFGGPSALWFSPSGKHLAFLAFNESQVPTFTYPVYDPEREGGARPYPKIETISYPKPGFANPTVEAFVFSLADHVVSSSAGQHPQQADTSVSLHHMSWPNRSKPEDEVVFEVAWISSDELLVRGSDRSAAEGVVVRFDVNERSDAEANKLGALEGAVIRNLRGGDGWIEHAQLTMPYGGGYLEVAEDSQGWRHLAFYPSASSVDPIWLTTGAWELDGGVLAVNEELNLAFVLAASPSTERHVYSAALPSAIGNDQVDLAGWVPKTQALTSAEKPGYFGARFSPGAGFWVESYEGPGVPRQRVRSAPGSDDEVDLVLEDNAELAALVTDYLLPTAQWTTATVDDLVLNVKEIRPPNMDESGKTRYPLLLAPYGGPTSQSVHTRFEIGFNEHLAAELGYIILVVDGRGTGFRGKSVRNPIRGQVGAMEARDQIEVARLWAGKRSYVDSKRVGIHGWSFGGYLTGKVLELGGQPGSEGVISLGMAVAPVTDWRFYDSVYTERYMLTPEANPSGYAASGINNMTGFHAADFLLAHGTADDNVHWVNAASLLEKLTMDKVRRFESRAFIDSNHRVSTGGALLELRQWMASFLRERWGQGGKRKAW